MKGLDMGHNPDMLIKDQQFGLREDSIVKDYLNRQKTKFCTFECQLRKKAEPSETMPPKVFDKFMAKGKRKQRS